MQRDDAVHYLKEVLTNQFIVPSAISIEAPKDELGYKVHIKGTFDDSTVKEIAKKHNLAVKKENGELVVYKPIGL